MARASRGTAGFAPSTARAERSRLTRRSAAALVVVALSAAGKVSAAESAREILDRAKQLEETTRKWDDRSQQMKLVIDDGKGMKQNRELELYERRYPDEARRSVLYFRGPADVRGMGLLIYNYRDRAAEQWLYLPSFKRIRQITGAARNEKFAGSDLTYQDLDILGSMPRWSEEDAASKLIGEEAVDGVACHVIELRPQRDDIEYKRIVTWLGKEDLVARRVEFYQVAGSDGWLGSVLGDGADAGGKPTKRIQMSAVQPVGAIPTAHRVKVESPSEGSTTDIAVDAVRFDQGLAESLFTQRALERGRP
jgi:hypothetical protein